MTYLSGESLLRSTDDEDWVALSPNLSLRIGDRVWAQDGAKIEIRFPLGATAWVNYQSELDITRLESGSRGDTIQLALVSGEAAFDVKGFARSGSVFQVDLPTASIRTSRAARFRVNTLPDGTAQIGVISGSLVLETPDGLTDVSGGHLAEVQPDQRVAAGFPAGQRRVGQLGPVAGGDLRPAGRQRALPAGRSLVVRARVRHLRALGQPTGPTAPSGCRRSSGAGRRIPTAAGSGRPTTTSGCRSTPGTPRSTTAGGAGAPPSAGSGSSRGGGPTGRRAMSAGRSSATRSPGCRSATTRSTTGTGITAPPT